jgi:hypothetical protein
MLDTVCPALITDTVATDFYLQKIYQYEVEFPASFPDTEPKYSSEMEP